MTSILYHEKRTRICLFLGKFEFFLFKGKFFYSPFYTFRNSENRAKTAPAAMPAISLLAK